MAATFTLVSCIRKYHVYKDVWDPSLDESICCECEDRNPQEVPMQLEQLFWYTYLAGLWSFITLCLLEILDTSLFTASIADWDILFGKEVWLYISLEIVKQILRACVTPRGAKTVKILGSSHPRNYIHENPDWLFNCEIYILRKFPGIRYFTLKISTYQYNIFSWIISQVHTVYIVLSSIHQDYNHNHTSL